ncbi:hypothetical protein PNK_0043 [Candidatus Protochlamydia naegleriophila]|uniref:Uncharacterized protein n=1 Tax=Candidatus Protochlamydia naegleriophila TaxID=389348 RepID=A0A0U5JAI8_9BACT|nr:hypothetical protein [Candidatus Protochlamydia naegleriophila]CUI15682.1 hypothetical protein PNK_0043 [Candidatus Protochlamydia naegleriophila]
MDLFLLKLEIDFKNPFVLEPEKNEGNRPSPKISEAPEKILPTTAFNECMQIRVKRMDFIALLF